MPVDVTYCLSEWEKYFTEKPLSFNEFVDTYIAKPAIFPHILKTIDEISCQPSKLEYFIQGFIGSGKATLIYLLTAYKVYLYLILKSASEFYDFIPSADVCMIIFATDKKSASLTVNAFLTILEGIPFFKKVRTISECFDCKDTALYTTAYPDDLLTFKRNNNVLHVIAAKDETDLINTNPIIGVFTELDAFKKKGVSMEMVFGFYQKLSWRIESRCKGKFSTIIVEKNPGSLYEDAFDRIMYDNKDPKRMVIFFHYYWQVFKDKDPDAKLDALFNITTCQVVDSEDDILPGDFYTKFPSVFQGADFLCRAKESPEQFLKDVIGMPITIKQHSETLDIMKDIVNKIHNSHLEISIKNGTVFLESPIEKLSINLSDYQE